MSLLSRLFRKAPRLPSVPEKAAANAATAQPARIVPDRALEAAKEEQALAAAIGGNDSQMVARLVVEGSSTKVRQMAAQAVEDPAVLRQLIRDVRGGNDKSVYRILTSKRDALLEQERKIEALRAEINAVAAAIERHSRRPHDPLYGSTLEQLETRWKAVAADAEPNVQLAVQQSIDRSREVIAQHLRQIALVASRELAAANAAAEAQRLRELEEKTASAAAAERAQALEEHRRAEAEKREALALAIRQIGGLIRKAHAALTEGSTGRAAGLRRAIEEKLPTAPPLPPYLANQLQQVDAKLNELRDWKSFSVTPKRLELMEEMESLVGSTLEPPALADRIKDLQQEWKTLSKGAGENLEADWQRFQDAAQKAYQPCREYFEAQSLARQENLQRREALLARLAAFEAGHNWEQPDWRTVMTALRESRQEWRRYSQVDRAAGKEQQEKFGAVTAALQNRLDAEYAANVKQKRLLIEQAERLIAGEDSRVAIDSVKELQQKWRATGPVPRDADQQLWEEFRQHCDAVFQKRQQAFAEYSSELEINKAKAIVLCEELQSMVALSGPGLLEGARRLGELREEFAATGEFPRGDARQLRNRFERAFERCEESVARQHARDAQRSWTDLLDAANHVRAYRLGAARGAAAGELEALRQSAENHIAAVVNWPKGGLEALKNELARGDAHDLAANEAGLRLLCIRAEVLTDTPTPPEDLQLRRQYQVQRLVRSMGQGISADEARLDTLTVEWVGAGPTEEGVYLQLLDRFKRCRERGLAGGGS
jgi:hypothetical protein